LNGTGVRGVDAVTGSVAGREGVRGIAEVLWYPKPDRDISGAA
jgi:hypothetical protein